MPDGERVKLTKAQRTMLERARRHTFTDGTGDGVIPFDGYEERTLKALKSKGLVSLPVVFTRFSGARITDLGRRALSSPKEV